MVREESVGRYLSIGVRFNQKEEIQRHEHLRIRCSINGVAAISTAWERQVSEHWPDIVSPIHGRSLVRRWTRGIYWVRIVLGEGEAWPVSLKVLESWGELAFEGKAKNTLKQFCPQDSHLSVTRDS